MYDKQASSQNFPPQGITSKFLANQVNGIVRLGPAEHMGTVEICPTYFWHRYITPIPTMGRADYALHIDLSPLGLKVFRRAKSFDEQ